MTLFIQDGINCCIVEGKCEKGEAKKGESGKGEGIKQIVEDKGNRRDLGGNIAKE
jgi:hypothetical protein